MNLESVEANKEGSVSDDPQVLLVEVRVICDGFPQEDPLGEDLFALFRMADIEELVGLGYFESAFRCISFNIRVAKALVGDATEILVLP